MNALLLVALLLSGRQEEPPAPAQRWFTEFGEEVLSKAEVVALCRVERVLDLGTGASAATLAPARVLHGALPEGKIVALGERGALATSGREDLFLLERWRGGERWRVQHRLSGESAEFAAKLRWIEGQLAAASRPTPAERLSETRRFLLDLLGEEKALLRLEAAGELRRWARRFPDRFEPGDADRLRAALSVPDATFHRLLVEALEALERAPAPPAPASRPVSSRSLPDEWDRRHARSDRPRALPPPRLDARGFVRARRAVAQPA